MSRITEALTKAGQIDARQSAGVEGHPVPWQFELIHQGPAEPPRPEQPSAAAGTVQRKKECPSGATAARAQTLRRSDAASHYAERLVGAAGVSGGVVEQYRRLAATLHQVQAAEGVKILLVASAVPGEGKTLLASNLGLILSGSFGRRVLLIDADLRRPSMHSAFGLDNASGITDHFEGDDGGPLPVASLSPTLDLVMAGPSRPDPIRIVTGSRMRALLREAAAAYEWVIVDTPPVGLLPDAHLLASMADRVLLVIEAGRTPYEAIQQAIETVGRERIIGAVLNRATASAGATYGDYAQYFAMQD